LGSRRGPTGRGWCAAKSRSTELLKKLLVCSELKQTAAACTVLQASTNTQFDEPQVVLSGFPWLSAVSEDSLVLVRTPSGIKIKSIESKGSAQP
jgi:hypothetical protein